MWKADAVTLRRLHTGWVGSVLKYGTTAMGMTIKYNLNQQGWETNDGPPVLSAPKVPQENMWPDPVPMNKKLYKSLMDK
ncbi:hypothetical protein PoB_004006400 [Plakobranchus ocellatus]|uniref:Uncharacterized protein n=1 Tax=Plakobranchus ocellatus TaxID=259542 RepID=A0AAV4B5A1_9GAST|nr:hypothetical protein PoB_004006400 [Plakobranchus ocellatus]